MAYMVDKKERYSYRFDDFFYLTRFFSFCFDDFFLSTHRTSYLHQYSKYDNLGHEVNKPEES